MGIATWETESKIKYEEFLNRLNEMFLENSNPLHWELEEEEVKDGSAKS